MGNSHFITRRFHEFALCDFNTMKSSLTWKLRVEALLMGSVRLPWGTSIVMLAQEQPVSGLAVVSTGLREFPVRGNRSKEACSAK